MKTQNSSTNLTVYVANTTKGYAYAMHFVKQESQESIMVASELCDDLFDVVTKMVTVLPVLVRQFQGGVSLQVNDAKIVKAIETNSLKGADGELTDQLGNLSGLVAKESLITVSKADGRSALCTTLKKEILNVFPEEKVEEKVEESTNDTTPVTEDESYLGDDFDFEADDFSYEDSREEIQTSQPVVEESEITETIEETVHIPQEEGPYISQEELDYINQMGGYSQEEVVVENDKTKVDTTQMPYTHTSEEVNGKRSFKGPKIATCKTPKEVINSPLVDDSFFFAQGVPTTELAKDTVEIYLGYHQYVTPSGNILGGTCGYFRSHKAFKVAFKGKMGKRFSETGKHVLDIQRDHVDLILEGLREIDLSDERKANIAIVINFTSGVLNTYLNNYRGDSSQAHLGELQAELDKWKFAYEDKIINNVMQTVKVDKVRYCGSHRNTFAINCAKAKTNEYVSILTANAK